MKRLILICLAMLMVAGMLAACGSKKAKPATTEPTTEIETENETPTKPADDATVPTSDASNPTNGNDHPDTNVEVEINDGEEETENNTISFDDLLAAADQS